MANLSDTPRLLGEMGVLSAPPSLGELRRYRRETGVPWHRSVIAVAALTFVAVAVILALAFLASRTLDPALLHPVARTAMILVPASWTILLLAGFSWWITWRLRDVRLWQVAVANGLYFEDRAVSGGKDWRVTRLGTGFAKNMVNTERASFGNEMVILARNQLSPKPGSERSNLRRPFAFAELTLPAKVPHIILKNRRSRILPLAGLGLGNRKKLSLEGDFDRHFTLLCPEGYERDALQIFTPDVMAVVVDAAGSCEVELIDDRLYLYFRYATPLWRPDTLEKVQCALELLRARFERQTSDYRDDRASTLGGRRTTSANGISAATVLAFGAVILLSAVFTALSLFVLPNL